MNKYLDIKYNEHESCKLDLYVPDQYNKAVILIHGGGLVSGSKDEEWYKMVGINLALKGYFVSLINYRLMPEAKYPDYINDACDAIKYVKDYINNDKVEIYVGGHSAGAYISTMLAVNDRYLFNVGINNQSIKGWLIDSAQHTTHFHILSERGLSEKIQRIDESATLYYINENTYFNKMLLITYEDDLPCRPEQNALFYKTVKYCNENIDIRPLMLPGGHCQALTDYDNEGKSVLVDIFDNFIKN